MRKIFAAPNILIAAILLVLYRKELQYEGCRYHFDTDEYKFWFHDPHDRGPAAIAQIRKDSMVPARAFKGALHRLHLDFQEEKKRVGNPPYREVSRG